VSRDSETRRTARGPVARFIGDYCERHCYAPNAALHAVGIPLTLAAVYLALRGWWLEAGGALAGGYLLQALGHRLQGSEVGELALLRRLVGRKRPKGGG